MKKLFYIFLLSAGLPFTALSQKNNMVIFSEDGHKFILMVNGIRQNSLPESNVKISELNQPSYKVKILFQDSTLPAIDRRINFQAAGREIVYSIDNTKKGMRIRYVSDASINSKSAQGKGIKLLTSLFSPGTDADTATSSASLTNNTTSSASVATTEATTKVENAAAEQTQKAGAPCKAPMSDKDFANAVKSINARALDDSKRTVAEQVLKSNCLTCSQVSDIMRLFSFEGTRIEFARQAYSHTYDRENYYMLNDAFASESSIQVLNEYINGKK